MIFIVENLVGPTGFRGAVLVLGTIFLVLTASIGKKLATGLMRSGKKQNKKLRTNVRTRTQKMMATSLGVALTRKLTKAWLRMISKRVPNGEAQSQSILLVLANLANFAWAGAAPNVTTLKNLAAGAKTDVMATKNPITGVGVNGEPLLLPVYEKFNFLSSLQNHTSV